jgi:tRNA U38,U39,U40 pseudouridine synthase TruA
MLHVAAGKMELEGIQELFEEGTRQRVPMAAPAHGLCLEQVYYEDLPGVGESAEVPKVLLEGGGKRRLPLLDG